MSINSNKQGQLFRHRGTNLLRNAAIGSTDVMSTSTSSSNGPAQRKYHISQGKSQGAERGI